MQKRTHFAYSKAPIDSAKHLVVDGGKHDRLFGMSDMIGTKSSDVAIEQSVADAIIEALEPPAALLDGELRVVSANRRFLSMLSSDLDATIGRQLAGLGDPSGHERLRAGLAFSDAGTTRYELESDLPSLGRRLLMLRAARLLQPLPGPGAILLTVEDVTARSGPVAGLAKAGTLAAATHELRQPLQAMTLLGSLIARRVTDPDLLPLIQRLEDTITAMAGMLNTLLDINRWNTDVARAEPSNFVLAELLDRLGPEFAPRMNERNVDWRIVGSRQSVHSDQRLLGQILRSMVDYTLLHCGAGRILLGARRHGSRLRVEVWSNEFRVTPAETVASVEALRPQSGATVGLAMPPALSMIRRLADLLGHRIELAIRPDGGSMFSIDVPMMTFRPAIAMIQRPRPLPTALAASAGTVFVIDDNAGVRDTMRDLLDATGWATEGFASSEEFLQGDRVGRAGCILVDAVLPGMSGIDLLRALRDQRHRLPAIMLTGAGDVRMAVQAMEAGAINFIEKPIRYEELLPTIERAFDLLADSTKLSRWREEATRRAMTLTARQRQILDLVLEGKPSRNIAIDLGVSRRTVENHRAVIMKKMGAASIPQLIRVGIAAS